MIPFEFTELLKMLSISKIVLIRLKLFRIKQFRINVAEGTISNGDITTVLLLVCLVRAA